MSSVEVRKLVTEYIIVDMLPLTIVESPTLKKRVDELLPHPVQLPDRKTICSHLEKVYESMMKKIKENLEVAGPPQPVRSVSFWPYHFLLG